MAEQSKDLLNKAKQGLKDSVELLDKGKDLKLDIKKAIINSKKGKK